MTATRDEVNDEIAWAWWCRQRAAQGLPPTIEDPVVIARLVTLAFAGDQEQGEGGGGRAPAA